MIPISKKRLWIVVLVLLLLVGWNFWLPTAQDFLDRQTKASAPPNVDFFAYYTAGVRFSHGQNPYYWSEPGAAEVVFSEYLYPPTLLPVYSAITHLDYDLARRAWFGLYMLAFGGAIVALARTLRQEDRWIFAGLAGLLTLLSYPLLYHVRNGQADMFIVSLIVLAVAAYGRGWRFVAAFLLALGAVWKVSPALLLIFFVLYLRDWRFLAYFCLSAIGIVAVSLLVVPFDLYKDYIVNVLPHVSQGMDYWFIQSVSKVFAANESLASLIGWAGLALTAGFTWWAGRRMSPDRRTLTAPFSADQAVSLAVLALNMLVALAFGGRTWPMTYVWTIPLCALVMLYLVQLKPRPVWMVLWGGAVFLLTSKVYGFPVLESLNLIGALAMMGLLVGFILRREARAESGES
jgi:hypothetical protein